MATIGTFTKQDNGFTGVIRTLSFTASVTIEPVSSKRGDKSPDYRVFCQSSGPGEIGAAWETHSNTSGLTYLSVKLDDPSFPAAISCRLVKASAEHEYSLLWERNRRRD
jgi:uncharacterized protein (DUF736 family)